MLGKGPFKSSPIQDEFIISCELLKTGQVTSYHDDDDGDLELGISHDYTILTTGQYSSTTNIVINGKTHALSNNCVKDNRSNKMWARYVPLGDIGPDSNGKLLWIDTVNAEDIWSFVSQANANSLGGYNDWRIPNRRELDSIVSIVEEGCGETIDLTAFPSAPGNQHWTSSTNPCNAAIAYFVHFNIGHIYVGDKETGNYYVRLVRS